MKQEQQQREKELAQKQAEIQRLKELEFTRMKEEAKKNETKRAIEIELKRRQK